MVVWCRAIGVKTKKTSPALNKTTLNVAFYLIASVCVAALLFPGGSVVAQRTANASGVTEPLLVDMKGNGCALTSAAAGVRFNLSGDRTEQQVAWTERGSDDAFLAVDVNNNGIIDSGLELVGGMSPGPNGFATLLWYDGVTNLDSTSAGRRPADGMLDAADAFFAKLILWTDANHNGRSEEDELESAAHAGIVGFATGYVGTREPDAFGNVFTFKGYGRFRTTRDVVVLRDIRAVRLTTTP